VKEEFMTTIAEELAKARLSFHPVASARHSHIRVSFPPNEELVRVEELELEMAVLFLNHL
jgi:hypothetical protein